MATPIIMPKQGQSVESCIIVGWKKRAGDAVKIGDIVCEVETDKATFEVESPATGTLLAIFFEAGSDVPVLTPIAAVGSPGENVESMRSGGLAGAAATPAPATAPVAATKLSTASAAPVLPQLAGKIMASPRAKALAAARGVSLARLHGSGPGGRIIERDVAGAQAGAQAGAPAASRAAAPAGAVAAVAAGPVTEIKVSGVRKLIAQRMLASITTTAQLTLNSFADARALQDLRRKFKASPEPMGLRDVTINDMVLFAVARALLAHPDLNAHFTGDLIRQYASVHLGFAVDTPRGLMVPVIRNADSLGLRAVAAEAARLAAGCREGGLSPDEMAGATFTLTNLGSLGVTSFTPVLNPPQVGIIGIGAITPGPVIAADGSVSFIPQIGLSLTINHQAVDGAPGARFLQTLASSIAGFDLLLAR
jgi:pyruvate dehydrogenase E2 component (dihydrolipoamide acetyltransferase)